MERYVPPEGRTVEMIRADLEKEFARWDEIYHHGCRDPFWWDGVNLNLVRNHIIHDYRLLREKMQQPVQLSLFDTGMDMKDERPVPPEMPAKWMCPTGRFPDRLKKTRGEC